MSEETTAALVALEDARDQMEVARNYAASVGHNERDSASVQEAIPCLLEAIATLLLTQARASSPAE